jgi:hypothetical protein
MGPFDCTNCEIYKLEQPMTETDWAVIELYGEIRDGCLQNLYPMAEKPQLTMTTTAIKAAFELLDVPAELWPQLTRDMLFLFDLESRRIDVSHLTKDMIDEI